MTIVELGRTTSISDRTTPTNSFIRRVRLGPFETDATLLSTFPGLDESARETINITGVRDVNGAVFIEQFTIGDMNDTQQSFFWDFGNQTLYLHLPSADNPFTSVYQYGSAQGFSDNRPVYIDGVSYLPLIEASPAIRQQQDIENYDQLAFITGAVRLSNVDGRLDDLKDEPVYGNDVIIYYLDDQSEIKDDYTASDITRLATLFVEDYDISLQEVSLRVQDRRKSQNRSVPDDRFTSTAYPDADPEIWGTVIPVLWGAAREIPTVVTNGTLDTGNVDHRAAMLLTVLGTVYVKDDDTWVDVTANVVNTNLATGEFEIPAAQGRDADGAPLPAKLVSPTGIAITRLTDIIKDANERYTGTVYNSSSYDTTEWEAEETNISTGAYYLSDEKKLFEVIRDIQNGANLGFRYEIKPDGRRTIRVDREDRVPRFVIPNIALENRTSLPIQTDSATLVAEVVVAYAKSYESGRFLRVSDDTSAAEVLETYTQRPRKEYRALVTSSGDAAERAGYVRSRFDTIRGIGEFVLMGEDYLDTRIYDIVEIEITPDEPGNAERPFYGVWRCKVLSVDPDPRRATTTITAVLVDSGRVIDGGNASTTDEEFTQTIDGGDAGPSAFLDGGDADETFATTVDGGDAGDTYSTEVDGGPGELFLTVDAIDGGEAISDFT